jgi:hypothetical protein
MRLQTIIAILATCVFGPPTLAAEMPVTPHARQQARQIKALSDDDIDALREGMGMAKAAELNGYPGPAHVLGLATQLGLTPDQLQQLTAIFERMSAEAKLLGGELIAREQVLDQLFARGEITPDRLAIETAAIGELNGRCARCIWPRIWRRAVCCTPIRSLSISISEGMATQHQRLIISPVDACSRRPDVSRYAWHKAWSRYDA